MKKVEQLFTKESNFDNKSILNKLNKNIDKTILDKIESGVTLEDINNISLAGLPVLKYKTQITIHGKFPELQNNYIFGYKNVFQNKNLSIGVKYNAIDENKRQRIAKRLNNIGFHYTRNSQDTKFSIVETVNKENFEQVKNRFADIKSKIDTSLFYGQYYIWVGEAWGMKYLCFDLYINAIYETNIEPFLNKIGATIELYNTEELKKQKEDEELRLKYEEDKKQAEIQRARSQETKKDDLLKLSEYPRVEKTSEPGFYILKQFNYENELIFKAIYIYLLKGKKKPRFNRREFDNLTDALNYECSENWSDSIYNGRVTGHKIR